MRKFKLLVLTLCSLLAGNVFAENCGYIIKFSADGIQETELVNGQVSADSWGSSNSQSLKKSGREQVMACLDKALNSTSRPPECSNEYKRYGTKVKVGKYAISGSLKSAVFNQICSIRKMQPNGNQNVTGIKIFTNRNCGNSWTIANNLKTICNSSGMGNSKITQDYINLYSDYHEKTATDLKNHIKSWCTKNYSMAGNPNIKKFEVNNEGKIRAKFDCSK